MSDSENHKNDQLTQLVKDLVRQQVFRPQKKLPIGVLWKKTDKQGNDYFAGVITFGILGEVPIVIFEEKFRENDKSPHYVIRQATNRDERED